MGVAVFYRKKRPYVKAFHQDQRRDLKKGA
ncbi:hypothetical protein CCACVL1_10737 [Corchorus capsularis]|uniref:Uncharacterized protein n=1 Tax=Corchorus capsularis TaxID=210143 RepID=A0A1R3IPX6_COCAP|nr:hypothetical protein CCACVL1_10737 [Corchorus capsularis]